MVTQAGKDLEEHLCEVVEQELAIFKNMSSEACQEKLTQIAEYNRQATANKTKELPQQSLATKSTKSNRPPSPLSRTRLVENPARLPPSYVLSKAIADLDSLDCLEKTKLDLAKPATLSPQLFSIVQPPKSLDKDSPTNSPKTQSKTRMTDDYKKEADDDDHVDFIDNDDD